MTKERLIKAQKLLQAELDYWYNPDPFSPPLHSDPTPVNVEMQTTSLVVRGYKPGLYTDLLEAAADCNLRVSHHVPSASSGWDITFNLSN